MKWRYFYTPKMNLRSVNVILLLVNERENLYSPHNTQITAKNGQCGGGECKSWSVCRCCVSSGIYKRERIDGEVLATNQHTQLIGRIMQWRATEIEGNKGLLVVIVILVLGGMGMGVISYVSRWVYVHSFSCTYVQVLTLYLPWIVL